MSGEKTMKTRITKIALFSVLALTLNAQTYAAPFQNIRIGDRDGFGFNADPNFNSLTGDQAASGLGPADRDGDGRLDAGDVLPSLNGNKVVAYNNGDDFDNRLGENVNGIGFINTGTAGVEFTDISLSTSYTNSQSGGNVYNANTGTYGTGGLFPHLPATAPNQPGFLFDFKVLAGDITNGNPIFFNMLFGDYDVTPAIIEFTFAGSKKQLSVSTQSNGPDDGLIQGAFAELDFNDVFTWDGSDWLGSVAVDFIANNEPYTAFDYVELSLAPFQALPAPEPGSIILMLLGLTGLTQRKRIR